MQIIDIQQDSLHIYKHTNNEVQKMTTHISWSEYKKKFLKSSSQTVILLDETCFMWYHVTVKVSQKNPFTRQQYKRILQQKVEQVQSELGTNPEQMSYLIKNMKKNNAAIEFIIGESGELSFDICFFVVDTAWSDLAHMSHVRIYPRWYFLISHPLLSQKEKIHLLVLKSHVSEIITLENGWYKKISLLNAGDDLLMKAFEEAGLDPSLHKIAEFAENSIGEKLLQQAHDEYTHVFMNWVKEHVQEGEDSMVISRLIGQSYFVKEFSAAYIKEIKGRMIPYRGSELNESYGRNWNVNELPVLLLLHKMKQ